MEVKLLEMEFRKHFQVDSKCIDVTFQRYEEEWGEYIELGT